MTDRCYPTSNFLALIAASPANRREVEDGRWGVRRAEDQMIRRKASAETAAREAARLRYERRSNRCPVCFTVRAVGTGTCLCEERCRTK